jgi:hypothetical protein
MVKSFRTKISDNREFFFISAPLLAAFLLACGVAAAS